MSNDKVVNFSDAKERRSNMERHPLHQVPSKEEDTKQRKQAADALRDLADRVETDSLEEGGFVSSVIATVTVDKQDGESEYCEGCETSHPNFRSHQMGTNMSRSGIDAAYNLKEAFEHLCSQSESAALAFLEMIKPVAVRVMASKTIEHALKDSFGENNVDIKVLNASEMPEELRELLKHSLGDNDDDTTIH